MTWMYELAQIRVPEMKCQSLRNMQRLVVPFWEQEIEFKILNIKTILPNTKSGQEQQPTEVTHPCNTLGFLCSYRETPGT